MSNDLMSRVAYTGMHYMNELTTELDKFLGYFASDPIKYLKGDVGTCLYVSKEHKINIQFASLIVGHICVDNENRILDIKLYNLDNKYRIYASEVISILPKYIGRKIILKEEE